MKTEIRAQNCEVNDKKFTQNFLTSITVTAETLRAVAQPKMRPLRLTCRYVKPSGIINAGGASPVVIVDDSPSSVEPLSPEELEPPFALSLLVPVVPSSRSSQNLTFRKNASV